MLNCGNYTKKKLYSQIKQWQNCSPISRCHNYKKCPTCSRLYRQKEYSKATKHLSENHIKQYKYKYYLVFTSNDLKVSIQEKNSYVDLFMKDFLSKKRNKNFIINKSTQYFITKEISYNEKHKDYNPHYNAIILSDTELHTDNKQFKNLLESYNVCVHVTKIYKSDNSYKKSIEKIINYSLKFESERAELEKVLDITKYKRNVLKSELFDKSKSEKLRKRLYIHIQEVKDHYDGKIREAKEVFKRNINKKQPKNYLRLLKSFRKKKKYYNSVKARQIKRLKKKYKSDKAVLF